MSNFIDAGSSGEWGWHATELAMRCPQAFAYNYRVKWSEAEGDELPVRPKRSRDALLKGSLVHQGIGHLYARLRDGEDAWAAPDAAIVWAADKLGEGAHEFIELAQRAVRAYESEYALENLEPLHIEEVFAAEIGGYRFTQRFDLVARDAAGRVLILDHKTTAMLSGNTASRYTLSGQFLGMANFGRSVWGKEFGGVVVNLIEFRNNGFGFKRVPVEPAPHSQRLFPLTVKHARDRIAALDASGADPMEWPKALSETICTTSYGNCEFYSVCRWGT